MVLAQLSKKKHALDNIENVITKLEIECRGMKRLDTTKYLLEIAYSESLGRLHVIAHLHANCQGIEFYDGQEYCLLDRFTSEKWYHLTKFQTLEELKNRIKQDIDRDIQEKIQFNTETPNQSALEDDMTPWEHTGEFA